MGVRSERKQTMRCDSCQRERTDEQLSRHDSSGIRFCHDREECHRYRTEGRFLDVAQEVIDLVIESGLCHAECAHDKEHGCVVVWSSGAQGQIAAQLRDKLRQ